MGPPIPDLDIVDDRVMYWNIPEFGEDGSKMDIT